jgi:hypothetical protein
MGCTDADTHLFGDIPQATITELTIVLIEWIALLVVDVAEYSPNVWVIFWPFRKTFWDAVVTADAFRDLSFGTFPHYHSTSVEAGEFFVFGSIGLGQ